MAARDIDTQINSLARSSSALSEARATADAIAAQADDKRFVFVDHAKALGILLVLLGHAPGMPHWSGNLIYTFHMPLFFFLSGFLLSERKLALPPATYFKRLLRDLGMPYLFFFLVSWGYWLFSLQFGTRASKFADLAWYEPLIGFVRGSSTDFAINPVLWFFPCLMTTSAMYYLLRKRLTAAAAFAVSLPLGVLVVQSASQWQLRLFWGIDSALVSLSAYAVGAWLRQHPRWWPTAYSRLTAACIVTAFSVALIMISIVNDRIDVRGLHFGRYPILYFAGAALGIATAVLIARCWPCTPLSNWLGANTLIIFPLHTLMFNALSGSGQLLLGLPPDFSQEPQWGIAFCAITLLLLAPVIYVLRKSLPTVFGRHVVTHANA